MNSELRLSTYQKLVGRVSDWIEINTSTDYLRRAENDVRRILASADEDTKGSCASISVPLASMVIYWLVDASDKLVKKDRSFPQPTSRAYRYLMLAVEAEILTTHQRGFYSSSAISPINLFHAICLGIVFDDTSNLKKVYRFCDRGFNDKWFAEYDSLDVTYGQFSMALGALFLGEAVDSISKFHPDYDDIFRQWYEPPPTLAEPLYRILNYHLLSATDYRDHQTYHRKHYPEHVYEQAFLSESVCVFPLEVIALYRLRHKLGLETPRVDHPLMSRVIYDSIASAPPDGQNDKLMRDIRDLLESCQV